MERALASLNDRRQYRSHRAIDHRRGRIKNSIAESTTLFRGLTEATPPLLDYLTAATGVSVSIDGELFSSGRTPTEEEVSDLLQWVATQGTDGDLYATDGLQGVYRASKAYKEIAAGILAIPLGRQRSDFIVWYRPEVITLAEFGSLEGPGFSSRNGRHFATTVEPRTGHSLPWADEQLAAAQELQSFIQEVAVGRYNKLARINEQLKTAYSELEDFSYTVSHDLRAPLRGIDGYAEILMEEYRDELSHDAAELVRTIQHNAALMNQSITDILELSRVGRVQLRVQDCDMVQLVKQASQEIGEQLDTTVKVSIEGPLPSLRGDCAQLLIVVKHLLSNAVKYSSKQAEQLITVGFRRSGKDGDGQFYVSDNGIGIPAHHQERIFGMFNRLVIEQDYSGKGVGLAIVKRIILRHNGRVSVESEVGQGATFLFYTDLEADK
jgi:light-regulated signal transduction histidine kinase (bacteriophytochrome)